MFNKIKFATIDNKVLTSNDLKLYFFFHKKFYRKNKRIRFCFQTKRTKGFYKFFNLSRQSIKEFAKNEQLPGIIKSSW